MQNGSTAFRFVRLAVLPFFAVKSTLLKVRCTHYSEIFLYSPESLFASFLWKYPNSKTLMERRSSIRFCNFFTPSAVGWTSIACCAPSIRREMRKYLQFSITRSQILMRIPAEQSKMLELFLSMAKKRNTQLIITSHESRLLASEMLRNDEICFVYKTAQGKSIINPLEKYQLRADKKVYAALFDGTLDAGPSFDEAKLSRLSE